MMMEIEAAAVAEVQSNLHSETEQLVDIPGNADSLVQGILEVYQPSVEQINNDLQEIVKKQKNVIEKMKYENKQLSEAAKDDLCCTVYSLIKTYQEKVFSIKKELGNVHEKTMKLKKRALRLQQLRQEQGFH
ncbi:biogenesis of lysosome-related organelles complex 1 subunit 6 [Fopius arisanus]|uniref:Biogenesis of lysosome-related organelles complex 1 subunit 6 n=1 Tax=Fopius arisanus TaxID=64838 RepID=A0A9R1TGC5_9HYME|nr:PREDICTED: biogenesis of lysosome-related organelles complex 1 subunit 6-like [Fopius arisanus]XP_011308813.1 PREDICTED: biogenesis of lysosome-related organelles complex 1 subunit 6-like [Fopius arisanus]XP_011308814.1 PREDICTED: biogenesis of lysosome-related organelles complex 1 subunit 6-like [Fopius arisanus]